MRNLAAEKVLLRLKKWQLACKARNQGLDPRGTKLELATRIAMKEQKHFAKMWKMISN